MASGMMRIASSAKALADAGSAGDEESLIRILEMVPDHHAAVPALAELLVGNGETELALQLLQRVPETADVRRIAALARTGAVAPAATSVFFFSDPMMGILAVVNLLALVMLFPIAKRMIVDFGSQLKAGVERPVLNPDDYADLDIDRTVWTGKAKD